MTFKHSWDTLLRYDSCDKFRESGHADQIDLVLQLGVSVQPRWHLDSFTRSKVGQDDLI